MSKNTSASRNKNIFEVTVKIPKGDAITKNSCGQIVVEIVKHLAYQKLQIPYTYDRLKYVVEKKRESDFQAHPSSRLSEKYFNTASVALDTLETVFKNLMMMFESECTPSEICIVFGSNIVCAKEVYRIIIPEALDMHFQKHHFDSTQKLIRKVLRSIYFSEDVTRNMSQALDPTNMFLFLKQRKNISKIDSRFFLPVDILHLPPKIPQNIIIIEYVPTSLNCCQALSIFNDMSFEYKENNSASINVQTPNDNLNMQSLDNWFRSPLCLKGFKACFVNGQCISNDWIT